MPNPLPVLVFDEIDSETGETIHTDNREIDSWRPAVIQYINEWAGEMLASTDWYIVKSVDPGSPENGGSIPADIIAERVAIRDAANLLETQLLATTTLAELDAIAWANTMVAVDPTHDPIDTSSGVPL